MASLCPFEPFLTRSYRRNEWSEDSKGSGDEGNEARSVTIVPGMPGRRVRASLGVARTRPRKQNLTALRTRRSVQPPALLLGFLNEEGATIGLACGRGPQVVTYVADDAL